MIIKSKPQTFETGDTALIYPPRERKTALGVAAVKGCLRDRDS